MFSHWFASTTSRRDFLGDVARSAGVAAGIASLPSIASASPRERAHTTPVWDMSWTERLIAPHRAVFELPAIAEGMGLQQARMYMEGYRAAYGDKGESQVVIVMRSAAVPMAFNDILWEKYGVAQQVKARGTTNPYLSGGDASLATLRDRGAILLACHMATMGQAEMMASRTGADVEAVKAEVRANLAPGVLLMPNGVFAVLCAQDAGCKYFRSGM
jgi:hypothetical protein